MKHTASRPEALRKPYRWMGREALLIVASLAALTCAGEATNAGDEPTGGQPIVVLVSFDGFRWDYPDRQVSPNLRRLAARGVRAEGLIPSFPSKTFPNHYAMVTGLAPDRSGIVANTMYDPEFDATFSLSNRGEVQDARWWGGVPAWVTAERRGVRTAPMFWPGSEAPIDGVRPSHWLPFDGSMAYSARVQWILDRLGLPAGERPRFLTLYFDETDVVGHEDGPDSDAVLDAILHVDAALGLLLEGLDARGLSEVTNVIVVSDHGMIPTRRDRAIFLDDYVDLAAARPVDWNPVLALWPEESDRDEVYAALRDAHPHLSVYLRDSIPARFDYGAHRRVPPILGVADDGWTITNHRYFDEAPERADGGNHGYHHRSTDMQGVFIAAGPAFRKGIRVPAFDNVHVYALLMAALGLPAETTDADLAVVEHLLAQ